MPVLIDGVIGSKDHAHAYIACQFFETKDCGAIRQPGKRQTVFAQINSQIVIPQSGNIAANRRRADARGVQSGRETTALSKTFVENRSVKREGRRPRRAPARNRQFDEHSGCRCHTDFQDTSAVDHFPS
jgi:hypothetical protein